MNSKKNTPASTEIPSNIRFTKLGKFVMITISLVWVVSEIVLLVGLKDGAGVWMRFIQIAVSVIPLVFLNNFVKEIMTQAMKNLRLISTENNPASGKTTSPAFFCIMAFIFIVGGVASAAVEVFKDNETTTAYTTTGNLGNSTIFLVSTTEDKRIRFDFSGDPKYYDVYFKTVVDRKELFDVLDDSLRYVYKEDEVLETELNETLYGEIEEETDSLQTILEGYLEEPEMKGKRILKTINGIIIDNLLKMDREYKIPENRQEIADAYLVSADNELDNVCLIDYENAVKYLWGSLYVSITWNKYNPETIDRLIDAYENIKVHNPLQADRVANIQAALKVIKARFEQEPVEPLEYK